MGMAEPALLSHELENLYQQQQHQSLNVFQID
jgi:hypothetical protein